MMGRGVSIRSIYARIGDTNTPPKGVADIDKFEYLWRKRIGVDLSVTEKLLLMLDSLMTGLGILITATWVFTRFILSFRSE